MTGTPGPSAENPLIAAAPAGPEKPLTLAEFTSVELIVPSLVARDMTGVIRELSETFQQRDARWDARRLCEAALEREQQMSTAMEFGAAFPHVRSDACLEMRFALGCAGSPFRWGRPGALNVEFVFLNAIPANEPSGYLRLLSGMARLGKDPVLLEQLRDAATAAEVLAVLGRIPVRK